MTRKETITFDYEHCGECSDIEMIFPAKKLLEYGCCKAKGKRIIPDIWGDIPDWCPLPDKEVK